MLLEKLLHNYKFPAFSEILEKLNPTEKRIMGIDFEEIIEPFMDSEYQRGMDYGESEGYYDGYHEGLIEGREAGHDAGYSKCAGEAIGIVNEFACSDDSGLIQLILAKLETL